MANFKQPTDIVLLEQRFQRHVLHLNVKFESQFLIILMRFMFREAHLDQRFKKY